ncbi:MAG: hypothetical protein HOU81_16020 [Hamadaea sp.]|uniref:hypothetical protein n=1 Tax=Hamadaea sp. TaxID=2024425 RepID=UPI00181E4981|nr:hypothetical protein [Hamadaea sp.]NUR72321.1 hypothetical protein [Hamadaea sp.]NUT18703.1 hypothetical protein [Hamadaea sp.]
MSTGVRVLIATSACTVLLFAAAVVMRSLQASPDVVLEVTEAHVDKVGSVSRTGDQEVKVWFDVVNRGSDDAVSCIAESDLGRGLVGAPTAINAGTVVTFNLEGVQHTDPQGLRFETDFHVWADCGGIKSGRQSLNLVIEGPLSATSPA